MTLSNRGFLGSLFDLSFTEFVTTKIIKFIFLIAIAFSGFFAIGIVVAGFKSGFLAGLGALFVVAPLAFLLYVILARVWCEVVIAMFRIAENTGRMIDR